MSVRLTKELRKDIVRRVLDYKFKQRSAALKARQHDVVVRVINEVVGEGTLAVLKEWPAAWVGQLHGLTIDDTHGGYKHHLTLDKTLLVPANFHNQITWTGTKGKRAGRRLKHYYERYWKFSSSTSAPSVEITDPVVVAYAEEALAIEEEGKELKAKLEALVNSVTTTKKLYEVWPELATIVPNTWEQRDTHGTALVVSVADLNKTIPLPPPVESEKCSTDSTKKDTSTQPAAPKSGRARSRKQTASSK